MYELAFFSSPSFWREMRPELIPLSVLVIPDLIGNPEIRNS